MWKLPRIMPGPIFISPDKCDLSGMSTRATSSKAML